MRADLQATKLAFIDAVDQLNHAGRNGGLREYAGAEFTHEFRRQVLNESMAQAVVRMEDKAKYLKSELAALGEPAKQFAPTFTLANETISGLREFLLADTCDRVELANRVEDFEQALGRFNEKLQRLKCAG